MFFSAQAIQAAVDAAHASGAARTGGDNASYIPYLASVPSHLFGVAVMDGILNITYFRELRASGMSIAEAVCQGAEQRMRPMLMTALSAGVGLFPAAISHGIGSQVQRPLATVVVGGMFIGPLLLLVVAPALRQIFLSRERPPAVVADDDDILEPSAGKS